MNTNYDYREAVRDDVRQYIENNNIKPDYRQDRYQFEDDLNDDLWVEDSVTGNASGSYTFSTYQAEEYLCHNLDLLGEALQELGCSASYLTEEGAEACDVTIRCYLLREAIHDVVDEFWDDWNEEWDKQDEEEAKEEEEDEEEDEE